MAPIKEERSGDTGDAEGSNLWQSILSQVQSRAGSQSHADRSILVFGDSETGKTTLIAKLQGIEDPRKGQGLEYHYISIKDEYRDEHARLGVNILDGDPYHAGLLRYALNAQNIENTVVVLVASMSEPWAIMQTLHKWTHYLSEHLDRLKIPPEVMAEYRESLVRHWQEYIDPDSEGAASQQQARRHPNPLRPPAPSGDEERVVLPLGEAVLSQNLGVPIIVVITKSDVIGTLEKDNDYKEEHLDFIQQHIRKFCLNYGAALFYTSVKEGKNTDLLYRYLCHRIYGFPFSAAAYVVDKDSVFVPTGWDNDKKIGILYENMTSMHPDDAFEEVVAKPIVRKPLQREAEVNVEDEQVFLAKQQTLLSKQPAPQASATPPRDGSRGSTPLTSKTATPRPGAPGQAGSLAANSPKKPGLEAGKAGTTSEGILANFFNSLLHKKPGVAGQSPGPGAGGSPAAGSPASPAPRTPLDKTANADAAAELDRMARSSPRGSSATPPAPAAAQNSDSQAS